MKRIVGIISVIALILISGASVSAAVGLKDGLATGDDNDSTTWAKDRIIGQTWTSSSSYQLSYIELYMRRVGNPGNAVLIVRTVADGNLSTANLASIQLDVSSIPATNNWVRFDIPISTIIDIKVGSIYWWGIYAISGAQEGHYYAIRFDKENGYNGGTAKNSSDGGRNWITFQDFDNLFRIYGDVAEVTPILAASTSSSETSCVIPAVIAGIVSGLVAAAIAGVFAYGRGVAKGINRQTSPTQQKSSNEGRDETIGTGEKADTGEEEQKKSITLTMSCRIKNQISGEETYTERRLN